MACLCISVEDVTEISKVNNYIVRSYRDIIVVADIVTMRNSKAYMYRHVLKYKSITK